MAKPFSNLRKQLTPAARRQAEARAQKTLGKLRRQEKLTRGKLARALGVS